MKKDPRTLTPGQFEEEVKLAVKGADTADEAVRRVKDRFFPQPLAMGRRDKTHFLILALPFIGAKSVSILCER